MADRALLALAAAARAYADAGEPEVAEGILDQADARIGATLDMATVPVDEDDISARAMWVVDRALD